MRLGPALVRMRSGLLCLLALPAFLVFASAVRAEAPLDVAGKLRGVELGRRLSMLEDASHSLTIAQVTSATLKARFEPIDDDAPALGFTESAYWLRLEVENESDAERAWFLELAYPLIDDVQLFVPRAEGGFTRRHTGDMRPFRERDIAYRNFVFALEEPARARRTYYMRVATQGSMTLPLRAWTLKEFLEHQHLDWGALCIFYGVVLMMASYNACVALLARQREYLPYAGYIAAVAFYELVHSGHAFQFLFPDSPLLLHRIYAASGALSFWFACVIFAPYASESRVIANGVKYGKAASLLLMVSNAFIPYAWGVKALALIACVLPLNQFVGTLVAFRRGAKQAGLLLAGWGSIMLGALISMLLGVGLVPATFVTTWSVQIGLCVQVVLLASALADKINTARAALGTVNVALSTELSAVERALRQAEEANQRAERATRVRDEFIATMSHEFRTPLNPIINIPQGMRDEFSRVTELGCGQCQARFELEQGEEYTPDAPCPDCGARALTPVVRLHFSGNAARARKLLCKVERSGEHLLRVVNGILDFSKMEAGQMKLLRERFDAAALVEDVVSDLDDAAQRADILLVADMGTARRPLFADPQRVREVLTQLIENAIKFRRGAGQVTVALRDRGDVMCFSVEDQGVGIAKEHLGQIFSSFEQVSKGNTRGYGGTGLGLSIARSLVEMHGGAISAKSEPGFGSTFQFTIPKAEPALGSLRPSVAGASGAAE